MKKLRVGFVGAGWMGLVQLQRLVERDDVEVLALLEPNAQRGKEALEQVGLPASLLVDDYEKIVNDRDIDIVWLVSPNSYHGPQSLAAMQVGKHIFCEKPAATEFADFCKQIELEEANPNLITFVDYLMNFDSLENRLKNMVADGEFGTLTQVQVNYRHPVNIVGDKVWKLDKSIMGDAIGMGIVHSLSAMVNLMSAQARPVGVFATSMEAKVRGFEADPVWNIMIRFDNGSTGLCFGNIDHCNGYDAYHNILGTEGGFIFDSYLDRTEKIRYWSDNTTNGQWVYPLNPERCREQGHDALLWPEETTTPDSGDVVEHQTGACVGHFIECVKSGKKSPLSFSNSAIVGEIGWAAQMSAGLGKEIALPLHRNQASEFFNAKAQAQS